MATLMISAGETASDAPGTRLGGIPLVPENFAWPTCRECGGFMQFVAQIEDPDSPAGSPRLLSIFMCNNNPGECSTWEPDSGANRALFLTGPLQSADVPTPDDPDVYLLLAASAVKLVEFEAGPAQPEDDDYRNDDFGRALTAWPEEHPDRRGDVLGQVGGQPSWLQFDETPACSSCRKPMWLAAQLFEHGANFGSGEAFAFHCPDCSTAVFLWQC